jgi:uncharacterized protein (DUF433 family)
MADDRFEIRLDMMGGKPVIRGTRVPVETIWRKLSAGMSLEAIVADHPRLTREDVLAIQVLMEAQDASAYRLTDEQVAEVQRRLAIQTRLF